MAQYGGIRQLQDTRRLTVDLGHRTVFPMPLIRAIHDAEQKVRMLAAMMYRAGALETDDLTELANKAGVKYTTFMTALRKWRLSTDIERKVAALGQFDLNHRSWFDDRLSDSERRSRPSETYRGHDRLESFRTLLLPTWDRGANFYCTRPRKFSAADPHMMRHEISDGGQHPQAGSDMQLIFSAHFEPFHHPRGIVFGFRKAAMVIEIECEHGTRAHSWLGYPEPILIRDALMRGESTSHILRWRISRAGEEGVLEGEYQTHEQPLLMLGDYGDGTRLHSRIEVNIYDGTSFAAVGELDVSANKRAMIEQVFARELPSAEGNGGWIAVSSYDISIARYRYESA